jgi:hypothetical protein
MYLGDSFTMYIDSFSNNGGNWVLFNVGKKDCATESTIE